MIVASSKPLCHLLSGNIAGVSGCCGAAMLYRLEACYETLPPDVRARARVDADFKPLSVTPDLQDFKNIVEHCTATPLQAIPLDIALSGMLAHIYVPGQNTMFLATDSNKRGGDVHRGPYSTRGFIRWLQENDLAVVSETKHRCKLSAFNFQLKNNNTRKQLTKARYAYRKWYNDNIAVPNGTTGIFARWIQDYE